MQTATDHKLTVRISLDSHRALRMLAARTGDTIEAIVARAIAAELARAKKRGAR